MPFGLSFKIISGEYNIASLVYLETGCLELLIQCWCVLAVLVVAFASFTRIFIKSSIEIILCILSVKSFSSFPKDPWHEHSLQDVRTSRAPIVGRTSFPSRTESASFAGDTLQVESDGNYASFYSIHYFFLPRMLAEIHSSLRDILSDLIFSGRITREPKIRTGPEALSSLFTQRHAHFFNFMITGTWQIVISLFHLGYITLTTTMLLTDE